MKKFHATKKRTRLATRSPELLSIFVV